MNEGMSEGVNELTLEDKAALLDAASVPNEHPIGIGRTFLPGIGDRLKLYLNRTVKTGRAISNYDELRWCYRFYSTAGHLYTAVNLPLYTLNDHGKLVSVETDTWYFNADAK